MVALWIVPTPLSPRTRGPTLAIETSPWFQGDAQPKAHQRRIFTVEEGKVMLRERNRQPYARPNAGAILQPRLIALVVRWGPGPTKALPPLPIHGLREDPLLLAQPAPISAHRLPVNHGGVGTGSQASPLLLRGGNRSCARSGRRTRPDAWPASYQALDIREHVRPRPEECRRCNLPDRPETYAACLSVAGAPVTSSRALL